MMVSVCVFGARFTSPGIMLFVEKPFRENGFVFVRSVELWLFPVFALSLPGTVM